MSFSDDPIIPSDSTPPPARNTGAPHPPRRRRATRRDSIPHDTVGQAAFLFDLSRRAYPSFELFVFALACGAILGLGFLLNSQAVLLLGILVTPLMTPWVGFLLALLTGSPRFLFETFMALLISAAIVFICGLMSGFAARLFLPMTLGDVYSHSHLWIPELVVLVIGAVTLVWSFVRSENKPFLPSIIIAYAFYLPVSAGGFGLGSGLEGIFPQGLLVFATHFALAGVIGLITLFALKLRPSAWGIFFSAAALALFAWTLLVLMGPILPSNNDSGTLSTSTPGALPSLTPSLSATTTSSPRPVTATSSPTVDSATNDTPIPLTLEVTLPPTETPTITMTIEPAPVFGTVKASEGGGANLRQEPNGKIIMVVSNGTILQVLPEFQVVNKIAWIHVLVKRSGQSYEGWMLESTVAYATPEPNFGTPFILVTPTP